MNVFDLLRIDGRVAVVTGCSSGLGITFAETLAEAGADLVVCARRESKLRSQARDIARRTGKRVHAVVADIGKEADVVRLMREADNKFGRVDILVNNAGINLVKPTIDLTSNIWRDINRVNLDGTFYCAREAARLMINRKTRGSIINIASLFGLIGDPFTAAAYYASKGAVVNLTRAWAVEWAPHGIRVNSIAPGFFPSELAEKEGFVVDEKSERYIREKTPLARMGDVDELKGVTLLLASDAGSYITGQILVVDGGWSAM